MRILLIHNFYRHAGGEDTVFFAESKLLEEHGHIIEQLTFDNKSVPDKAIPKLLSRIRGVYNTRSYRKILQTIEQFAPDIIHVHNFFHIASPSIFYAAHRKKIPVVMTLHNFRLICPSAILFYKNQIYEKSIHRVFPLDAIRKGVFGNSSLLTALTVLTIDLQKLLGTWRHKIAVYITFTEFGRQKFLDSSLKLKPEQIVIKPNFVPDLGTGSKERSNFFLFIGRLSEEKGIKVALEAAALGNFELKILGDGPLKEEVETYAQKHPNIQYLGFQNKDFIIDQLKKCKALIFPSLWYEGMPMTILEAFSTGTPVIASNLGAPSTMIEHQHNGLHFEAGNVPDLLAQIRLISEDDHLLRQLQEQARRTYEESYSPEKNYEILLGIYRNIRFT